MGTAQDMLKRYWDCLLVVVPDREGKCLLVVVPVREGKVPAGGGTSQGGEACCFLRPVGEFFIYFSTYSGYK